MLDIVINYVSELFVMISGFTLLLTVRSMC